MVVSRRKHIQSNVEDNPNGEMRKVESGRDIIHTGMMVDIDNSNGRYGPYRKTTKKKKKGKTAIQGPLP